jgi:predicted PhzF superfamily epimerase YddE/YHI9
MPRLWSASRTHIAFRVESETWIRREELDHQLYEEVQVMDEKRAFFFFLEYLARSELFPGRVFGLARFGWRAELDFHLDHASIHRWRGLKEMW